MDTWNKQMAPTQAGWKESCHQARDRTQVSLVKLGQKKTRVGFGEKETFQRGLFTYWGNIELWDLFFNWECKNPPRQQNTKVIYLLIQFYSRVKVYV